MQRVDEEATLETIESTLKSDPIGRNADVARFIQILRLINGPYSIFIDAPWGSGKTFFVKQVAEVLKSANPYIDSSDGLVGEVLDNLLDSDCIADLEGTNSFLPIYFNAWENDHYENPIMPLLATIAADADSTKRTDTIDAIKEAASMAIDAALAIGGIPVSTEKFISALSGKNFLDDFNKSIELRSRIDGLITSLLPETANKAVLFIDELDRCRPEFATKLLEQTKGLFQQENVIVVYSTDKIQLANALEGLYGSSYDRLKYLERFHDFEFALTPVAPISYLEAKGVSVHSSYFFMKIAMAYIAERECPPRTCNRFVEKLNQGKAYIDSMRNNGSRGDWVANLSKNALLPTFIAMAEFEPLKWDKVRAGADFKFVFEFAKTNLKFIEYLDSSISEGRYGNANSLTDSVRKNCVEDVCALIFLSDHSDKRFEDARKRAGSWWDFDTEICRSLIFPDVKQKN